MIRPFNPQKRRITEANRVGITIESVVQGVVMRQLFRSVALLDAGLGGVAVHMCKKECEQFRMGDRAA
jgi:hypothetical protein